MSARLDPLRKESGTGDDFAQPVLLVVEDEPDDFILLRRALLRVGAVALVRWAQTAPEALIALAQLQSRGVHVCVVTDVKLPGADGFELLRLIKARERNPRITFTFLTGRPDPATEQRAYSSGADAFFIKPVRSEDWMEVARALGKLVARS